MSSPQELAESIANRFGKLDDYALITELKSSILSIRAEFVKQRLDKNNTIDIQSIVYLKKIPLKLVDELEVSGIDSDMKVLRSEIRVDNFIESKFGEPFFYVGAEDLRSPLSFVAVSELGLYKYSRFTSTHVKYAYVNGYVYLYNCSDLEYLTVGYVPYNPAEVPKLAENTDIKVSASCYNKDWEYQIEPYLVRPIRQELLREFRSLANDEKEVNVN